MNTNLELIKQHWETNLITYDPKYINGLGFNNNTIDFLTNVGLMRGKPYESIGRFVFLDVFVSETIKGSNFIKLAENFFYPEEGIYIELGSDNLFCINLELKGDFLINSFCNSTIENFVLFETINKRNETLYPNLDDDEKEGYQCARETIKQFKEIDMPAIYPYSYWTATMLEYAINFFYDTDDKFKQALQSNRYRSIDDAYFDVLINGFEVLK